MKRLTPLAWIIVGLSLLAGACVGLYLVVFS